MKRNPPPPASAPRLIPPVPYHRVHGYEGGSMRRIAGWIVFVSFLVAVGAFVHAAAGPVPTWSVVTQPGTTPAVPELLGGVFLTAVEEGPCDEIGPFTVRDVATGAALHVI